MKRSILLYGLAGAALLDAACGKVLVPPTDTNVPITGQSAALVANSTITTHLDDLALALKALQDSKLVGRLFPKTQPSPCPVTPPGQPPVTCDTAPTTSPLDLTTNAKELERWFAEHVFVAANIEAGAPGADATHVVFRLQPASVCTRTKDEAGTETLDADCVKQLTQVPVRLTVSEPVAGDLDIAVTVGSTHPLDVALHHDGVAGTVSLGEAKAANDAMQAALGHPADPNFPSVFAGKVKAALTRNGPEDYTLALSVVEAVEIGNKPAGDPKHFDVKFGVRPNVATLQLKGTEKTALASLDLGAVDAEAALDLLFGRPDEETCTSNADPSKPPDCQTVHHDPRTGLLTGHLAGVSAAGLLTATDEAVHLTGVGLGNETSWVKFNGTTLFALDLNAQAGRRFDLTVVDAPNGPKYSVSPSLTVGLVHNLKPLVAQFPDLPNWALDGTAGLVFDGAPAPTVEGVGSQTDTTTQVCTSDADCTTRCSMEGSGESPAPPPPPGGSCDDAQAKPCQGNTDCSPGVVCLYAPPPPPSSGFCVKPTTPGLKVSAGKLALSDTGATTVVVEAPACLVTKNSGGGDHPLSKLASGACE